MIALPRRPMWDDGDATIAAAAYTESLKLPGGTQKLWPVQGAALHEARTTGGLMAAISVGGGKTLISLLAARVLGAKRPMLILPAPLVEQTVHQVIPEALQHWDFPVPAVYSFETFGLEQNDGLLAELRPDYVGVDEGHRIGNMVGRTRLLQDYDRSDPGIMWVILSGTFYDGRLDKMSHLAQWALKPRGSPLPNPEEWTDLQVLADCVDRNPRRGHAAGPGYLYTVMGENETVSQWVGKRLSETQGWLTSWGGTNVSASLVITKKPQHPKLKKTTREMMKTVADTWEDPNGERITHAPQLWQIMRQLSLGFWYRWDPRPPFEWMMARQMWNQYVRHRINTNRSKLYTPARVETETRKLMVSKLKSERERTDRGIEELEAWDAIEDTFVPNTVTEWVDMGPIDQVLRWAKDNPKRGLVWIEFVCFGEELARRGMTYFPGGKKANLALLKHKGTCAVSIHSHGEGKNLQHNWHQNLCPSFPSSGKRAEQFMARTHRPLQPEPEVTFDVWTSTEWLEAGFDTACANAREIQTVMQSPQKLCYARII